MTFYGREAEPKPVVEEPVLITYEFNTAGGRKVEVQANLVEFKGGYVSFWSKVPGQADRLVHASPRSSAFNVKEVSR